jgi:hypothetical protein
MIPPKTELRVASAAAAIAASILSITLFTASATSATTLIAYRTDSNFVIAIDSLRVFRTVASKVPPPAFTACKVFEEHQAIFAFAGHDPVVFDPKYIVRQALEGRTSIRSAANIIGRTLSAQFEAWIPNVSPQFLAEVLRQGKRGQYVTISSLALGAYEPGSGPIGLVIEFRLAPFDPPGVNAEIVWFCDSSCTEPMTIIGELNKIVEHLEKRKAVSPNFQFEAFGVTAADRAAALVQIEINAGNHMVGPPVAVAEVGPTGVSWPYPGKCFGTPSGQGR